MLIKIAPWTMVDADQSTTKERKERKKVLGRRRFRPSVMKDFFSGLKGPFFTFQTHQSLKLLFFLLPTTTDCCCLLCWSSAIEMALLLKRVTKFAPLAFRHAFKGQENSNFNKYRIPLGTMAGFSGGGAAACFFFSSSASVAYLEEQSEDVTPRVALDPAKWIEFQLQDKAEASHNTQLFRFSFDPATKLGLDIASCILTRAPLGKDDEGKTKYVIRPYTPISDPNAKGYFDLLIKVYPEGKMSQHLASLKPGDVVEVKGPIKKLRYSPNMKKHIGMIAGGTGITPMLQIIDSILKNPDDNTQVSLIYANVSPDDILLKGKLDVLAASHPNLKVFYTVDNTSENWRGGTGYISKDMVLKGLPAPSDDTLILVCGPPGLMKHISGDKARDYSQGELSGLLKDLGYTEEMVYKF